MIGKGFLSPGKIPHVAASHRNHPRSPFSGTILPVPGQRMQDFVGDLIQVWYQSVQSSYNFYTMFLSAGANLRSYAN